MKDAINIFLFSYDLFGFNLRLVYNVLGEVKMSKKGISFYFGFITNPKARATVIKNTGFDCVITSADERYDCQNGKIASQCKIFSETGLIPSSFHMRYKKKELKFFWKDGEIGDKIEKDIVKDIKLAKKYGFSCVVAHFEGEASEIGFNRIRRVLKVCEKFDVPLAVENIGYQHLFEQIFATIKSDYLKFCYDIGHNNYFDPDFDYLSKYGNKLIALHLHSNDGTADMHTLNKYGNVNWDAFAKKIAKINPNINLDYEILMKKSGGETENEVVEETFKQACELEKLIEKYK